MQPYSYRFTRRQLITRTAAAGLAAASFGVPNFLHAAAAWGDLVGRFVYDGPSPQRKKLKVDKDVEFCGKFDIRDESLMVGKDSGLANVFVYVRTRTVAVCPDLEQAVSPRVTLDNRDCIFMPHCLTIWYPKQEFYTVNSDPVAQNIAIEPPGDTPCNVVLPVKGNATYKFNRKQNVPVVIHCNYHPWESGYILARDNPYMAVSGPDGTFRLAKLPVGPLEFQVWQERASYLDTPQWPKGRFKMEIQPGTNDLGTIKLLATGFPEK